jgi:linoleoyl-CoA desaturase
MQTVKFKSPHRIEHQFIMALRKNVNQYFKENNISTKANASMVLKTVTMISCYLLPFIAVLIIPMEPWTAFVLTLLMGVGLAGIGMSVMHDACHGAYSKKQWINDLLGGTLYLLGSNVLNWKIQHNVLHHTYTNISGLDEDIDDKGMIRLSENRPLKRYHKYQFIYAFAFYGLMTVNTLVNDFIRLIRYNKFGLIHSQKKNVTSELFKMIARKIAYLFIIIGLPLLVTNFSIWQILLGFFSMHWVASIILSFVFQMAHVVEGAEQPVRQNEMPVEWSVHQLHTTSDFARNNKLLGWYVGGLNFQIEHHLFPNICHVHYKNIAPIVEKTAQEFGLPYNQKTSFTSAFISHISRLKQLGIQH